jgi:hypothetical protein
MPITQTITSLGTPPQTSDPTNFDARADALLATAPGGLPNMVTELNTANTQINTVESNVTTKEASAAASAAAALALAGAVMFNGATAYTLGQAAISGTNLLTYRRKSAGTSATDPSLDPTNWTPSGLPPVVVVRTGVNTTMLPGVYYVITAAGITLTLQATPGSQDLFHYRSANSIGGASWTLAPGGANKIEGVVANFSVNIANARGTLWFDSTDGYIHLTN